MKKAATLIVFLLIYPVLYVSASYIEVTSFSFNPEEPEPGESVVIDIRLANKNYDQDFDVTCRLFIDSEIYDVKVVPVTRRSSSGVTFTWAAESGTHVFSLEMSYYVDRNEVTDTFFKDLNVSGGEEIDYFSEAVQFYDNQSYVQAKIYFEQAKRRFEEAQNIDQALSCEEYISQCDDYIEANQKFQQAGEARNQGDLYTAIALYQQAQIAYEALNDDRALLCGEKIQEIEKIQEEQRKKANLPYYVGLLLMPVAAGLIAFLWLRRKGPPKPAPLPQYVPERKVKGLFKDTTSEPEVIKELQTIESKLDTKDPETFKSLVEDFRKQEQTFDKKEKEYNSDEAEYIKESMETVKQEIKDKGRKLQDIQKLKDLNKRCTNLLDEPVGDLVDAYNRYAQLHNTFDQIPDYNIPEQEEVRAKLREYYAFIQQQAKLKQSERQ